MGYTALYRKFRPVKFEELVGQEHITKTIKNQIISDRVGHAYLFNGGRGTGKTTIAKILARAVNCLNLQDGEPCNECEICKAALDGSLTDIVEMDAASNNSVEDVREIREAVNFLPTKAKYRVYIIDEVHMLSTGAFNALLKTLEEPPKHVKFLLATTEPQKIPATILSRCQRFDFKRISNEDIIKRLEIVCKESNIEISEGALKIIAVLIVIVGGVLCTQKPLLGLIFVALGAVFFFPGTGGMRIPLFRVNVRSGGIISPRRRAWAERRRSPSPSPRRIS